MNKGITPSLVQSIREATRQGEVGEAAGSLNEIRINDNLRDKAIKRLKTRADNLSKEADKHRETAIIAGHEYQATAKPKKFEKSRTNWEAADQRYTRAKTNRKLARSGTKRLYDRARAAVGESVWEETQLSEMKFPSNRRAAAREAMRRARTAGKRAGEADNEVNLKLNNADRMRDLAAATARDIARNPENANKPGTAYYSKGFGVGRIPTLPPKEILHRQLDAEYRYKNSAHDAAKERDKHAEISGLRRRVAQKLTGNLKEGVFDGGPFGKTRRVPIRRGPGVTRSRVVRQINHERGRLEFNRKLPPKPSSQKGGTGNPSSGDNQ